MKEYVLCFVERWHYSEHKDVLFIQKNKPEWQKGLLNLPGGSIEPGETPEQAAIRELKEETDLDALAVYPIGVMEGDLWRVYVMGCAIRNEAGFTQMTSESLQWVSEQDIAFTPNLIENLKLICPLCLSRVSGWQIRERLGTYEFSFDLSI